jgi:RNA polymerase sigma-70 factor (ECF subfamily)
MYRIRDKFAGGGRRYDLAALVETLTQSEAPVSSQQGVTVFPLDRRRREFERLILPHTGSLLRFARRMMPEHAEDVTQQALLHAWRGFEKFRGDASPRTWLFHILVNAVRSEARRFGRLPVMLPLEEVAAWAQSPVPDQSGELLRALDRLPEDQKEALLLAAVEGFTCAEIGAIVGVPVGTVASRLSRARGTLREQRARLMELEMRKKA